MDKLVFFYPDGHEAHFQPGHPERPERIQAIQQAMQQAGWWETFPHLPPLLLSQAVLQAVHTPEYLSYLQAASRHGENLDSDTYTTPATWQLALNAAGGAAAVAQSVWRRQAAAGFAITRPPGHHATRSRGMGFCLLNNIALAAEHLLQAEGAQRLAIVDLDLHHGNGTQDIFWQREEVLFISTHQSPLYPGTGSLWERGAGPGLGYTANIPLPPRSGDLAFEAAMERLILPLLSTYQPEMLLVSVGFDPHWRDPLGQLQLSAGVLSDLVGKLAAWAQDHTGGRIALVLEGGYDLEAARACLTAAVSALLGQPFDDPLGPAPTPEGQAWKNVIEQAAGLFEVK